MLENPAWPSRVVPRGQMGGDQLAERHAQPTSALVINTSAKQASP